MQRKLLARLPAFHRNALQFEEMKKTSNIEHPTLNCRRMKTLMFDVGCSVLEAFGKRWIFPEPVSPSAFI